MATTHCSIYCRFSPRRNSGDCQSNEVQESACRVYAAERGYRVTDARVFLDAGLSGADEDRPALWAAVDSLKRGNVLLVHKYDRLARSVYLDAYLHRVVAKRGARIEAVVGGRSDSPEDELVRTILAAMADYERKIIAARTRTAMRHYQNGDVLMSRYPKFGKRLGLEREIRLADGTVKVQKTTEDCPEELAILERIRSMRGVNGHRVPPSEIARRLNAEGVLRRGKPWTRQFVARLCDRG